jgi:hypothetical protein
VSDNKPGGRTFLSAVESASGGIPATGGRTFLSAVDPNPPEIHPDSPSAPGIPVSRRQAIQWVMAAVAASSLPKQSWAQKADDKVARQEKANTQTPRPGYGTDPDLLTAHKPGDFWALTFNVAQKKTATALADTIIPKDDLGPAASEVGVVAMIDEWISAPYPNQQADRPVVVDGLAWIEVESKKRFNKGFAELSEQQKHAICDDICFTGNAKPPFKQAAHFFSRFRTICASAYYATPEGWKAIGYVGNVALGRFDGPPPEVLQKLGVTQTVS